MSNVDATFFVNARKAAVTGSVPSLVGSKERDVLWMIDDELDVEVRVFSSPAVEQEEAVSKPSVN